MMLLAHQVPAEYLVISFTYGVRPSVTKKPLKSTPGKQNTRYNGHYALK